MSCARWLLPLAAVAWGCATGGADTQGPQPVPTDRVTVGGKVLEGRVVSLDSQAVTFVTVYGDGELRISYPRIQEISTESQQLVILDDGEEVRGRIWGLGDGAITFGPRRNSAAIVPVSRVVSGLPASEHDDSNFFERLKRRHPEWKANLDLGVSVEDGRVTERKVDLRVGAQRRKKPTRIVGDFLLKFETKTVQEETEELTTKDEFQGRLTAEHDLFDSVYVFAFGGAERDVPRNVKIRAFPSAGLGYRFFDSDDALLQAQGGFGYVYENFGVIGRNDYASGHVGLEGLYEFGPGIRLSGLMYYLPGILDPGEDWLFRFEVRLAVPLVGPLAVRLSVIDVLDNNPTPDTGNNKLTTSIGLSLQF